MIDKLKENLVKLQGVWQSVQDILSVRGSLYVDMFGIIIMVRLLAVMKGFPPLSASEAAVWGTTVGLLAYSNGGPKQS